MLSLLQERPYPIHLQQVGERPLKLIKEIKKPIIEVCDREKLKGTKREVSFEKVRKATTL